LKYKFLRLALSGAFLVFLFILSKAASSYDNQEIKENSSMCLECHLDYDTTLANTAHRMNFSKDNESSRIIGCINCHDGWEEHLNEPSVETIVDLDTLSQGDQALLCGRCHNTPHQTSMVNTNPHGRANITCLDCHSVHNGKSLNLLEDDKGNYCLSCHRTIEARFMLRSFHPFKGGNVSCIDCHSMEPGTNVTGENGLEWTCQECHPKLAGPHIYEHPITYEYRVDGGGCEECHFPHGSPNERLLKQPGNGTCLQCHSIPPGHRTNHSGLGTKMACVDCHSEIHGSNDNPLFLNPDLGMILFPDCYQSGCHAQIR